MANRNVQVLVNFTDGSGNHLKHFGSCIPFSMNVAMLGGGASEERPDPAAIKTVLVNNGKIPAGADVRVVSVKNLDRDEVPGGILS